MKHPTKQVAEFELKDLLPIAMTLVVLGVGVAYGINVLADIRDDFVTNTASCGLNSTGGTTNPTYTACGADYNASVNAIDGVDNIPNKLPLIATVVIAAIIIGILVRYLFNQFVR